MHDPANNARLLAVEIRQIDDEGRIAADGRIRVGDRLTEINQRPVYQVFLFKIRFNESAYYQSSFKWSPFYSQLNQYTQAVLIPLDK